jgi:hypothetical protein
MTHASAYAAGDMPKRPRIMVTPLDDDEETLRQYVHLAIAVVALFVLQATLHESAAAVVIQIVVGGTALVLALRLGRVRQRTLRLIGALVVAALAGAVLQLALGHHHSTGGALLLINGLLVAGGPPVLFKAIARQRTVTVNTVLGAITIYVLIGLFFAFVYRAMLMFNATSFTSPNGPLSPAAMQYFSFVTITTLGFGDITPLTDIARTTVAMEALIGQVYLVTVVALVVGNIGRARRSARTD